MSHSEKFDDGFMRTCKANHLLKKHLLSCKDEIGLDLALTEGAGLAYIIGYLEGIGILDEDCAGRFLNQLLIQVY